MTVFDTAVAAVQRAKELGADEAECTASEGEEFSVGVRMGAVESLKQAGSRGVGNIYLFDAEHGRILVFDKTEGTYVGQFVSAPGAAPLDSVTGTLGDPLSPDRDASG